MKGILSALSGVLFLIGFVPYVLAIIRGHTKPAKMSWIIWGSLDFITLAGMYASHTVNGQILGACIGVLVVIAFALKYGVPGWSKLDKFCLGGAILGIALWQTFDSPVLGIITSAAVAFVGSIPTFVSAWNDPGREDKLAWTIFWISCVCAMFAIPQWTLADAVQPAMFFTIESIMMFILFGSSNQE